MKVLKHILFTAALVIGISITASAQSTQPKKPPPKPDPPIVKVPDKTKPPPREEKPKGDGKKPGMAWVMIKRESDAEIA